VAVAYKAKKFENTDLLPLPAFFLNARLWV